MQPLESLLYLTSLKGKEEKLVPMKIKREEGLPCSSSQPLLVWGPATWEGLLVILSFFIHDFVESGHKDRAGL